MSPRYCWITLACLLLVGCKADPAKDLLISELRHLEDQVYELEDLYKQKEAELESARRENNTLRKNLAGGNSKPLYVEPQNDTPTSPSLDPPVVDPGNLAPPAIELPEPGGADPSSSGPELPVPALPKPPISSRIVPQKQGNPSDEVTSIRINPRLTGGYDFDGEPGDEGVLVVIEPQNKEGLYVPKAGPISVVVIDATLQGEESRIARWDFDSIEANAELRKTLLGRGIHLELPWPNQPPEHAHLKLFVRYENLKGEKLEAQRDINVALPGMISNRWTPSTRTIRQAQLPSPKSAAVAPVVTPSIRQAQREPERAPIETARPSWAPNR